jgi:putative hydrolase of the HAD superfamily
MAIRTVLFDIGGVLEITPATGWDAKWETALQLPPGTLDECLTNVWHAGSIGAISEADVLQSIATTLKLDQTRLDRFMADLWDEYLGQPNTELATYFASLRPRYQTAILSNSFVGAREKEQERYQFGAICDQIIYSHEEGMRKPERRLFELTCERLGVQPAEIIFLDDAEPNITAAREFGMCAILFRDTAQAIADIQARLQADIAHAAHTH